MHIALFRIPVVNNQGELEACNRFLSTVRVLTVQKEFVAAGDYSFWSVLVEYMEQCQPEKKTRKKQVDYKEVLSPADFAVFNRLRTARKEISDREGVPVYTVFTNEQLAEIVTRGITTPNGLTTIDGVGKNRVEKYAVILQALRAESENETKG